MQKTHTTRNKLTQCSWKWFHSRTDLNTFYKIRHLIWLAGVRDQSRGRAIDNVILFIFLNFIALLRVQRGRFVNKDHSLWTKLNWRCNQSGKTDVHRRGESCPKLVRFFFVFAKPEDVVRPTLSTSLHVWLYFSSEIIFRVGTTLSADRIKPVVLPVLQCSLSRRQVNMA